MAFVLVEVVVAVTIQAPAANAALCDGPHCYGEAAWTVTGSGSGFRGAKVTLRSNCMSLPDYTSEFITNELWAVSGGGTRWVEIGITVGVKPGGYNTSPRRFWAENKAAGYFEHYYESYTFDNSLVVTARAPSDGSNDWELWYGSGTRYTSVDGLTSPAKTIMTGSRPRQQALIPTGVRARCVGMTSTRASTTTGSEAHRARTPSPTAG